MFHSARCSRTIVLALGCVLLVLDSPPGKCAEKCPLSGPELRKALEAFDAQILQADQRLRELENRAEQLMAEIKAPDRKRSLEEIREALEAISRGREQQQILRREAVANRDRVLLHAINQSGDAAPPSTPQPGATDALCIQCLDGTKITGKVGVEQFIIETASGTVNVPVGDLFRLAPGIESRPELAKRVDTLIAALGSDNFAEREAAQRELTEMGPMLRLIVAEHANDADAERKHRVAQILRSYDAGADQRPEAASLSKTPMIRQDQIQTFLAKYVGKIAPKQFHLETDYGTFTFELGQVIHATNIRMTPNKKGENGPCMAALKLRDGSHVNGQLEPFDLQVHGPYGVARIPLPLLQEVTVQDDGHSVDVILKGGDHLKGRSDWPGKLTLKTASGMRHFSPQEIAHIDVGAAALASQSQSER